MLTNKKKIVVVMALILVIATAVTITGCGLGGDPKSVVSAFFDSINKQDTNKFLNCFSKDSQDTILGYYEKADLKDLLTTLDETLNEQYGNNWRSKVKIGKAEKGDTEDGITTYEVTVTMEGEDETVTVYKEKGKYYIDENSMGGML